MIRSYAFTNQGRLYGRDIELFLMPTLLADTNLFLWVDLESPTEQETITILEKVFHFHPVSITDCITESESPKVEEYIPREGELFSPYLFMVIHEVDYSRQDGVFATNELNFFLGRNFLVTYHRGPNRSVQAVEGRVLKGTTPIARAPDRLAYHLIDSVVDNYKPALEELSLEVAELEEEVLENPSPIILNRILQTKREVMHLRKIIGPQREVLARFARAEFKMIRPHLVPYFRAVYDELYRIGELAAAYTDSLTSVLQIYLNISSNKTAEIVKVLTMITVITTPLMLVGTWYGMNYTDQMPEFRWKYGYLWAIGLTVFSTIGIWIWFKRKKWM